MSKKIINLMYEVFFHLKQLLIIVRVLHLSSLLAPLASNVGCLRENCTLHSSLKLHGKAIVQRANETMILISTKKFDHCLWNVLEGCFVVYMGRKQQKIVIQTKLLHCFLFKTLLANFKKLGLKNQGGLWISCEPNVFKCLLSQLKILYFLLSKLQC